MTLYEEFEQHLQDGLNHLYDPLYNPPASLWEAMGIRPHRGVGSLQRAMLRAIRSSRSQPAAPPDTIEFYEISGDMLLENGLPDTARPEFADSLVQGGTAVEYANVISPRAL